MEVVFVTVFIFQTFALLLRPSLSEVVLIPPYTTRSCSKDEEFRTNITMSIRKILKNISPCKEEEGWRKLMDVDMTNANDNCPPGLSLYTSPFRLCGRTKRGGDFCESTTIAVRGLSYTQVCGKIIGYHQKTRYSFGGRTDIETSYLDGVSLTYGPSGSRQHIWSFVAGANTRDFGIPYCPRPGVDAVDARPPFITNDYFCDSGFVVGTSRGANGVYVDNPLWDGVDGGCDGDLNVPPRCYVNNPPWFNKALPASTNQDIELRVCGFSTIDNGDTLLQEIEVYVK